MPHTVGPNRARHCTRQGTRRLGRYRGEDILFRRSIAHVAIERWPENAFHGRRGISGCLAADLVGYDEWRADCGVRRRFSFRSSHLATLVAMGLILGTILIVSEIAWQFDRTFGIFYINGSHLEYLIKNLVIGLVIGGLLLRNFFLQHERQLGVEREAAAHLEALHARIRPHFLFNTLNTIIAILRSEPRDAETALHDLSELVRAALRAPGEFIELREELEIARMYARIEQLSGSTPFTNRFR